MWVSFGVLMPVGIIIARFLQTVAPIWFHLHWIIQVRLNHMRATT